MAAFKTKGRPDSGKNRLYRILVSETAYLIWKLRNKQRIRDEDGLVQLEREVLSRWKHSINKRITMDRMLTNTARFKKNALDDKLIRATWGGCLQDEEDLPEKWPTRKGVLVGILVACPPGRAG